MTMRHLVARSVFAVVQLPVRQCTSALSGSLTTWRRSTESCMSKRMLHSTRMDCAVERPDAEERVLKVIKGFEQIEDGKVQLQSNFTDDLKLDSLDTVELLMAVEEEFNIEMPDADADKLKTVEETIEYIVANEAAQ